MPTSIAVVRTEHASRYLQQLCKHWSHKFAVSFDPGHGTVPLPGADLTLDADAAALRLALSAQDATALPRLREVVAEHLQRFAFREELAFDWQDAPAA